MFFAQARYYLRKNMCLYMRHYFIKNEIFSNKNIVFPWFGTFVFVLFWVRLYSLVRLYSWCIIVLVRLYLTDVALWSIIFAPWSIHINLYANSYSEICFCFCFQIRLWQNTFEGMIALWAINKIWYAFGFINISFIRTSKPGVIFSNSPLTKTFEGMIALWAINKIDMRFDI